MPLRIPSRRAGAALSLSALLVALSTACGSTEFQQYEPLPTGASPAGSEVDDSPVEDEPAADEADDSPEANEADEATRAPAPATSSTVVAMRFQAHLYNGDAAACDLLTPKARTSLLSSAVRTGMVEAGGTCEEYVARVGDSFLEPPSIRSYGVDETDSTATVRLSITDSHGTVSPSLMKLKNVEGEWLVSDWGVH